MEQVAPFVFARPLRGALTTASGRPCRDCRTVRVPASAGATFVRYRMYRVCTPRRQRACSGVGRAAQASTASASTCLIGPVNHFFTDTCQ